MSTIFKSIIYTSFFIISHVITLAQVNPLKKKPEKVPFPKDENGKIIFYEVVSTDTVPRDTLWKNAKVWIYGILNDKADKILLEDYLAGSLEAQTSFMVYTPSLISKMPHGVISYKVSIDIKDKKYRYTFTDFVFQYYKQDKNLKYVPVKGSIKPLEKEKYPGYQAAWDLHKQTVKKRIEGQIAYLKAEIVKQNKAPIPENNTEKPVIKTKDW